MTVLWGGERPREFRKILLIVVFFYITLTLLLFRLSLFPWSKTTGGAGWYGTGHTRAAIATWDGTGGGGRANGCVFFNVFVFFLVSSSFVLIKLLLFRLFLF